MKNIYDDHIDKGITYSVILICLTKLIKMKLVMGNSKSKLNYAALTTSGRASRIHFLLPLFPNKNLCLVLIPCLTLMAEFM